MQNSSTDSGRKLSLTRILVPLCLLVFAFPLFGQLPALGGTVTPGSLSVDPQGQPAVPQSSHSILGPDSNERTQISLKGLVPAIIRDQKPIWLFPSHLGEGKHLKPFLLVAGATAGLVALDQIDEPYFRNSSVFDKFKTGPVRGRNMTLAIVAAPLTMYLGGQFAGDNYAKQSGLFATEALGDVLVADYALKSIFGRLHPSDIPTHGDFTHTWFKYPDPLSSDPGSFPSGHSAMAFAVASVLSRRYHRHRWVPWVVYGAATIIALTRIPDRAHFASDVFAGSALGFAIGHFIPLSQPGENR